VNITSDYIFIISILDIRTGERSLLTNNNQRVMYYN